MRPIFLIGLDGATFTALDPLLAAGRLPTLGRLLAGGTRAVLRSVIPPITPAAWSSFMTGKEPAKHGVYDFRVYEPRALDDAFVTSHALRARTVWELLTRAGLRVATVSLPMTYPPRPESGTVVSGFDAPSVATSPPELRAQILDRIPDYFLVATPDRADPNLEGEEAFEHFVGRVERSFEQRTEVALGLLAEARWDVFMIHYQDVDVLQHPAWRFIAGEEDPARHARVCRAYERLDDLLGRLLALVPPDALVLVVSDHGFGDHVGRLFPNVLLRRWGYLDWHGRRRQRIARSARKRLVRLGIAAPASRDAEPWEERVRAHGFREALPLRWNRTRAYVALAEICGLLYVNLRGREPEGCVAPGDEREALVAELQRRFLAVSDPRDGQPVFADVLRGAELYAAADPDRRPDLVLVPRPGYSIYRDLRPRVWIDHHRIVAGTHRPEGILIASGPGLRSGRLAAATRIVDVAPTLLAVAGVPVPDDMDGRVLSELFEQPPTVSYGTPLPPDASPKARLSAAEESQVIERLRNLGYLT